MNKLFVFDLDDTLIDNVHDYAEPILQACGIIIAELGNRAPHVSAIVSLEEELDLKRRAETNPVTGKPFGYSMARFPGTLTETYRVICRKAGVTPDEAVAERLYGVGLGAFNPERYSKNIKPDAGRVIKFLRSQGDSVMLCTAGDPEVQMKKIAALKSAGIVFEAVEIVDKKTPEAFHSLALGYGVHSLYSVGNNYNSDIVPSFEAGYRGIYIPVETWETLGKMDEIISQVEWKRCLVFKSLSDILVNYAGLR